MKLLEVENLSCGYGKKIILKHLSFQIQEGELWCVLGANGIGKSTLFKAILGSIKPIEGKILLGEKDIRKWNGKERAKWISYVPQSHNPPFPFTVREVVEMGRNPYQGVTGAMSKEDEEKVEHALEKLHIKHLEDKVYTKISGGERQLVMLARAIAQETKIMILDEPVSNLDFGNRVRVMGYIRDFVKEGKTVIMTTHDPDHAFLKKSRVILLEKEGEYQVGEGNRLVDEKQVEKMYGVSGKILEDKELGIKTCAPAYGEKKKKYIKGMDSEYEYDWIAEHIFYPIFPYIAEEVLRQAPEKIHRLLDVGCGGGHFGFQIMERKKELKTTFFDKDARALFHAENRSKTRNMEERSEFVHGNVEDMPFEDDSYDLIISRGSMQFWENQKKAFEEIYRVLAPGGMAYIGSGLGNPEMAEEIRKKMKEYGFACFGERKGDVSRSWEKEAYFQMFREHGWNYDYYEPSQCSRWYILRKVGGKSL